MKNSNKNLISQDTVDKLHRLFMTMEIPEITKFWTELENKEIFLLDRINFFIDGNAKYIIGAMLKGMQDSLEGEEDLEEPMHMDDYINNSLA